MHSLQAPESPVVSVVLATYGRAPLLCRALAAIMAPAPGTPNFEIVVAVDGPDPDTLEVLREAAGGDIPLRWVQQPRRGGPARARNAAIRLASGAIIAITDDDCEPSPQWLPSLVAAFQEAPQVGVVIGKTITLRERLTPFSHFVENLNGDTHQTCNIAYRRAIIDKLDGFDERFPYSHEDTDLFLRAEALAEVRFAPNALVVHPPRELSMLDLMRSARRFEGDFIFAQKYPELYRKRHGGKGPVTSVFWDVAVKHVGKQLVAHLPWLRRSPLIYLRFLFAQMWFSGLLLVELPKYWRRHH